MKKIKINFQKNNSFKSSNSPTKSKLSSASYSRGTPFKSSFGGKIPPTTNSFEKRKLAEQRATKRLKEDNEGRDKKFKSGSKKGN